MGGRALTILGFSISATDFGATKGEENRLLQTTFRTMATQWHDEMLPEHFQAGAAAKYGYTARKGTHATGKARERSYVGKKEKATGENIDLVFSGATAAEATRLLDLRIGRRSAKVVLPRGLNRRHAKSRVDMRREVTTVLEQEVLFLERDGQTAFAVELADVLRSKKGRKNYR